MFCDFQTTSCTPISNLFRTNRVIIFNTKHTWGCKNQFAEKENNISHALSDSRSDKHFKAELEEKAKYTEHNQPNHHWTKHRQNRHKESHQNLNKSITTINELNQQLQINNKPITATTKHDNISHLQTYTADTPNRRITDNFFNKINQTLPYFILPHLL